MNTIKGDIFKLVQPGDMLIHGCNCQGVMGAGVAAVIAAKFPKVYDEYSRSDLYPGSVLPVLDKNILVMNAMTQVWPGRHAKLSFIECCMNEIVKYCEIFSFKGNIYLPAIGCGIGGLDLADCIPLYEILDETKLNVNLVIYE